MADDDENCYEFVSPVQRSGVHATDPAVVSAGVALSSGSGVADTGAEDTDSTSCCRGARASAAGPGVEPGEAGPHGRSSLSAANLFPADEKLGRSSWSASNLFAADPAAEAGGVSDLFGGHADLLVTEPAAASGEAAATRRPPPGGQGRRPPPAAGRPIGALHGRAAGSGENRRAAVLPLHGRAAREGSRERRRRPLAARGGGPAAAARRRHLGCAAAGGLCRGAAAAGVIRECSW